MRALLFSDKLAFSEMMASLLRDGFDIDILAFPDHAADLTGYGAKEIKGMEKEDYAADSLADFIAGMSKDYDYIFIGATVLGREAATMLSALTGNGMRSEITKIEISGGKARTSRLYYGGKTVLEEESDAKIFTVSQGLVEPSRTAASSKTTTVVNQKTSKITVGEKIEKPSTSVDITKASVIVSIGRGIGKKEGIEKIKELASLLHGELAGSRPICSDYHWLEVERQVGLSGKTVSPKIYMAIGISGQIQHVAGMRNSKTVIAINNDKTAPIFQECDYGIVGDLYAVVPLLINAIKQTGQS